MSVMDIVRRVLPPTILRPQEVVVGGWDEWWDEISNISGASPAKLFREQPHLHTVVTFMARNTAQLGLHTFKRVSESDRQRDRTSNAARTLAGVDGVMTPYELIFATVGDLSLYDRAYWLVVPNPSLPSGYMIRRLPPAWVRPLEWTAFEVTKWQVVYGDKAVELTKDQVVPFTGYSPTDPTKGSSAVEALRDTLKEQVEAAIYRKQVWKRGGRVSSVIQRPADAPKWTPEQRKQFKEDWYDSYVGNGAKAGGTPILEGGMELKRVDFSASEQQFVEAAKLSLVTVAAAYHVNPTMIGQNDGANYSNVREFRKMLYGDTLGPLLAQIEQRVNMFVLPKLGVDPEQYYVEFNIQEKLQGNFEEQAAALSQATGAPYMLRSEARARMNLPEIPNADELVVPLNVLTGGQASPQDSAPDPSAPKALARKGADGSIHLKAAATPLQRKKIQQVLEEYFARQKASVLPKILAGKENWWDAERWDGELTKDLHQLSLALTEVIGGVQAARLGFDADSYDPDQTINYLKAVAERYAVNINETTKRQLEEVADDGGHAEVFDKAKGSRAEGIAVGVGTFLAGFATQETARQISRREGYRATKTWSTGTNPRPTHARMNGETVMLDGVFSNGMSAPGDAIGGVEEVAGCNCSLEIGLF